MVAPQSPRRKLWLPRACLNLIESCCRIGSAGRVVLGLVVLCSASFFARPALANALTQKDVQILSKALGFLDPPLSPGAVAIVYAGGNDASKKEADAVAGYIGDGLKAGSQTLKAKVVDAAALGDGAGYSAIIAAQGAASGALMTVAKNHKIICITGDVAAVQAGQCIMAVQSDPKVEISVSRAAASAAGIGFTSAFRMMMHEI